jgi:putative ABC transport system permease protein
VSLSLALIALINGLLGSMTDVSGLQVHLSWQAAVMLVAVSVGLTLFAGILPSGRAAGKDPVVALRTE